MPLAKFVRGDQVAGIIMLTFLALALISANSPLAALYQSVHHIPVHLRMGALIIEGPLVYWINQGLMVIFFLVIGLEIKQQILEGHLNSLKTAAFPAIAAAGGMVVPALVYVLFNSENIADLKGWAVPTATDIVLALSILSLLGKRVPMGLKTFLTALAVFDDIGAVAIIGIFYGEDFSMIPAFVALGAVAGLYVLNRFCVTNPIAYLLLGVILWGAMVKSGMEAALAGIVIAAAVPSHSIDRPSGSPLRTAESILHRWSYLLVVPIFVFFNSGVILGDRSFQGSDGSVWFGIVLGLFVGKQVGVFGASFLAVRFGMCHLPKDVNWRQLFGASVLAGIGFTMSLFIATRAFPDPEMLASAKTAVLVGSFLSAIIGTFLLLIFTKSARRQNAA